MAELIWEGKYDKDGRKVAPLKVALPFQTVETVNESAQERDRSLFREETEWRNRLIWGDKKYVLPSLLPEFAGKVDLIYIDPPFDTGANFSFTAEVPDDPEAEGDQSSSFLKEPSIIEQKAYRDTWGKGIDTYLAWFYECSAILRELLADTGSIYVHLDFHVVHYAKAILDELYGSDMFVNEIVWKRRGGALNNFKSYGGITDSILLYAKSERYWFNPLKSRESEEAKQYIRERFVYDDGDGRKYSRDPVTNPASKPTTSLVYEYKGYKPPAKGWAFSQETMREWDRQGKLYFPADKSQRIRRKTFLDEYEGQPIQNLWSDIYVINSQAGESVSYPTQKPEALLKRILQASSQSDNLVLDCFCGSGTTAVAAERNGRRWIACDLGRFAIHTTRKRLLGIDGVKPFIVQNLGKYERQVWQVEEFGSDAQQKTLGVIDPSGDEKQKTLGVTTPAIEPLPTQAHRGHGEKEMAYREFILKLYHAQPMTGRLWLHGVKSGRMVHVGSVDAPVSLDDVRQIVKEFKSLVGGGEGAPTTGGVDVLGWDFAFDINETATQMAASAGVSVKPVRIPREVLEKKAVEQGDIVFFELASLGVSHKASGKKVELELCDFIMPPDDAPEEVRAAITHWSQWIDYWAVDWDHKGDTFHNQWQSYRTRKDPKLQLKTEHKYEAVGEHTVVVKVIDILGNDTTKTIKVKVG